MDTTSNIDPILADATARARKALGSVATSEGKTLDHWIAFGEALVAGRELFPNDDRGFGRWKRGSIYSHTKVRVDANTEAAVQWMVCHRAQLDYVRKLNPTLYAPRKLYSAWRSHLASIVDEAIIEGDLDDPERDLTDILGDVPADVNDLRAAAERKATRRSAALEREAERDRQAQRALEAKVEARVAAELQRIFDRLPEELREQVKAALGEQGQIEPPTKPKRQRKPKTPAAPVEDAEIIEPAA